MKFNIQYILLLFMGLGIVSCVNEDIPEYGQSNVTRNDPYSDLLVNTPVVSFVAGEPAYDIEFLLITPGSDAVTKLNVYKQFTDAATGLVSDPVLMKTYDIAAGNTALINDQVTFADLREGITINGAPLTENEVDLPVGSKWELTFEPVDGSGAEVFSSSKTINVSVLSPFAGFYTVITGKYFRIGVESGASNYTGLVKFIGSVDENTFAQVDSWGPFVKGDGADGQFVFDIDENNNITVLDDPSQLFFSGNEMLTCQEDAAAFANVPCADSNVLEPKADGKHIIKLTYGYHTTGSGDREFYEVLEKVVE